MSKEILILAVSIVTLMVAGFAAYTVYDLESPSPQPAAAEDYTDELNSIQAALNAVNEKLESLEDENVEELNKLKTELEQLKEVAEQPQTPTSVVEFGITTDKTIYEKGNTIKVTGHGVSAQSQVTIELLSSFGEAISTKTVFSDSTGNLAYNLSLPSFVQDGTYKLKATYNGKTDSIFITIANSDQSTSESEPSETKPIVKEKSSSGLSISLDKDTYKPGEIIWVTGIGEANQPVILKMIGPNEKVQMANPSVDGKGAFSPVFILAGDAEPGKWKITAIQNDSDVTITFTVKN